jgi:hypothetical protein
MVIVLCHCTYVIRLCVLQPVALLPDDSQLWKLGFLLKFVDVLNDLPAVFGRNL